SRNQGVAYTPWQTAIPRTSTTKAIGTIHSTLIQRFPTRTRGTSPHCGGSQDAARMLSRALVRRARSGSSRGGICCAFIVGTSWSSSSAANAPCWRERSIRLHQLEHRLHISRGTAPSPAAPRSLFGNPSPRENPRDHDESHTRGRPGPHDADAPCNRCLPCESRLSCR